MSGQEKFPRRRRSAFDFDQQFIDRHFCLSVCLAKHLARQSIFAARASTGLACWHKNISPTYYRLTLAMPLFILAETSAGYALLKSKDKKLLKRDDLAEETKSAEGTCNLYG